MELVLVSLAVAVLGAICIAWVLAQGDAKSSPVRPASPDAAQADAAPADLEASQPAPDEPPAPDETAVPVDAFVPDGDRPVEEVRTPVYVENRHNEIVVPVNALQLNAIEIINTQIERLQADYIRMDEERERLAQELLTTLLVEKIEGSAGRLKIETKKEAQDLRQQLARVSTDFERVQFRLASLQHLQERLDDPRVARQIDDLVKVVKRLARER